jgi:hypothetical protein
VATGVIKSWMMPYSFAPWTACFGYIKPDGGGPSIYTWAANLTPPLQSQTVSYDLTSQSRMLGGKGQPVPQATGRRDRLRIE